MQKLEKEQQGRDALIEHLQSQIEGQQRQVAELTARHEAQRAKTRTARVRNKIDWCSSAPVAQCAQHGISVRLSWRYL